MPKKKVTIILSLILVLGLGFLFFKTFENKRSVCFKNKCFQVEIADDETERAKGLSGRKKLEQNAGMFFVFETQDEHSFWMKDMLISLDIIWLDENGKVVFIKENSSPCDAECCKSILPDTKAKYVLEINSGKVKEMGLKIGDQLIR